MIKFRCKHCSGKIGVKRDFAGKRVRCPKCKEPVRVPKPAAEDDFELEMVAPGDDFELEMISPGDGDADGGGEPVGKDALADLLAMEANAQVQLQSHQPQPKLNNCPQCGNPCAPRAKVCVGCGYNFKTKGKLKTAVPAPTPAYGSYHSSLSSTEPGGFDRIYASTLLVILMLLSGCCCSPFSLILGIVGMTACTDYRARRNASLLIWWSLLLFALGVVRVILTWDQLPK